MLIYNFKRSCSDWLRCHGKKSVKQNWTENNVFSLNICVTEEGSNVPYISLSGRLPVQEKKILHCKDISINEARIRGFLKPVNVLIYYIHSVKSTRTDPQLERFIKALCHGISIFKSSAGILASVLVLWIFYANFQQLFSPFSQMLSEIQVFELDIYP